MSTAALAGQSELLTRLGIQARKDVDEVIAGWVVLADDKVAEVSGQNCGMDVGWIQASTGNKAPDSWCASACYHVGRSRLGRRWPLRRTASCDELLEDARAKGLLRDFPKRGALFLRMKTANDATHVGIVTAVHDDGSWSTIEGNTDPAGSANGYGVFTRERHHVADIAIYTFIHWSTE